jgi:hypothetical protein
MEVRFTPEIQAEVERWVEATGRPVHATRHGGDFEGSRVAQSQRSSPAVSISCVNPLERRCYSQIVLNLMAIKRCIAVY